MYEGDTGLVLRCELCNKPFDKPSTLKRHGYYCRSRKAEKKTRARSCLSCTQSKSKCDNARPTCSRCMTKALTCRYPARAQGNATRSKRLPEDTPGSGTQENSDVVPGMHSYDGSLVMPELADLEWPYPDWSDVPANPIDIDIDYDSLVSPHSSPENAHISSSGSPSSIDELFNLQQLVPFEPPLNLQPSLSLQPSNSVRSLVRRPRANMGTQRVATLIHHTLKAYPKMLSQNNNLPPLIHPRVMSLYPEKNQMEPLSNCMSLVRIRSSPKLFWMNVGAECERWRAEPEKLSNWGRLAAMQALLIYLLIRLEEGETEHNNCDSQLIATVLVLRRYLHPHTIECGGPDVRDYNLAASWKDWIYEESMRRMCVVYQVINILATFQPAEACGLTNSDIVLSPLPGKRKLWEAKEEHEWKTACEAEDYMGDVFGLAASGDLIKIENMGVPTRSTVEWEDWCSGMDGMGGLVMLTASLLPR